MVTLNPRWVAILAAGLIVTGCAGSAKLTRQSQEKLAKGNAWRAWELATRALDKEPGNPEARRAATAAGAAIVDEWQRKIHALAELDTLQAAEQVLELDKFRLNAAHYATVSEDPDFGAGEKAIRHMAARTFYTHGVGELEDRRPKQAYLDLSHAQDFAPNYRNAELLASRAFQQSLTRVAIVPFRSGYEQAGLGTEVASRWRESLTDDMANKAHFTRIVDADQVERNMTVANLSGMSRDEVVRLGRKMGAQRVVWGTIGQVRSQDGLHFFRDEISRRVKMRESDGSESVRWIEVPIEVVARERDVTVGVEYEVISVADGSSLGRKHFERSTTAHAVWTSYMPDGDLDAYTLVSDALRSSDPVRARAIESSWKSACGENTTLHDVLEARRTAPADAHYSRNALPRLIAGAAFVFLQDLPPAEDLALAALANASGPLRDDLLQLDTVDDPTLMVEGDRSH